MIAATKRTRSEALGELLAALRWGLPRERAAELAGVDLEAFGDAGAARAIAEAEAEGRAELEERQARPAAAALLEGWGAVA